jgi:hypothetical protein
VKSCSNPPSRSQIDLEETMKQVTLRIDDAAFERFMGMVSLCPEV